MEDGEEGSVPGVIFDLGARDLSDSERLFKIIFVGLRGHKFQKDTTKPYPIALPGLPDPLKCSDQTAKDSAVTKPN